MTREGPWRPPAQTPGPGAHLPAPPEHSSRAPAQDPGAAGVAGPPGAGPPTAAGPPPEDIHTAWVFWLAATGFALVGMLLNVATASFNDLPAPTRDAIRESVESAGADVSIQSLFDMALAAGGVLGVIAAVVTVWLAFRLRAGRGWARTLLDIAAIFLVVDAMSVMIGVLSGIAVSGERGDVVTFVVYSLQILAGLCAGVAVWRQHRPEAMAYTRPDGGAHGGR